MLGQKPPENDAEFEKAYQQRIRKDMLYGVYIPKDLADAFVQLNKRIDSESKQKFQSVPEEEVSDKLFFSLARWIMHNWGFHGGSRFSHYIKQLGIYHPEDMARFVIISYHRYLNKKSLNVKDLVNYFHEKQEQEKQKIIQKGEILHEEKRVRARPESDREGGGK